MTYIYANCPERMMVPTLEQLSVSPYLTDQAVLAQYAFPWNSNVQ